MKRGLILLMTVAVVGGGVYGGARILSGEPNEIRITVDQPDVIVAVDQAFTITLTIENIDLNAVMINGVGLDTSLLEGITVTQTDPIYREIRDRDYPLLGKWSEYHFEHTLAGGDELTVTLTLQSGQPGTYSGDVTVWVASELLGMDYARARRAALTVEVTN